MFLKNKVNYSMCRLFERNDGAEPVCLLACLLVYGCPGSLWLYIGFLKLTRAGATFFVVCRLLIAVASPITGARAPVVAALMDRL